MKRIAKNVKGTMKLAKVLARSIKGGEVILFYGDLGAGKTTFIKYFGKYLGVRGDITSPTFTILKQYSGKKHSLYHLDLYRISDPSELEMIGVQDCMNDSNGVTVVEWAELAPDYFGEKVIKVIIDKVSDDMRKIEIVGGKL